MAVEIERKFLTNGDGWRGLETGIAYRQGYLATSSDCTVRVRLAGDTGYLTVKGATQGITRSEFEYEIPFADAEQLLMLCTDSVIEKTRYRITINDLVWEVDEFHGDNAGLVVAEVELEAENQSFVRPEWVGDEVSHDSRYRNSNLAVCPFQTW